MRLVSLTRSVTLELPVIFQVLSLIVRLETLPASVKAEPVAVDRVRFTSARPAVAPAGPTLSHWFVSPPIMLSVSVAIPWP